MNTHMTTLGRTLPRRPRTGAALAAGLLSAGLLTLGPGRPAQAQSPGISLASLLARMTADEQQMKTDEATISNLQSQLASAQAQEQADIRATQTREQNDVQGLQKQEQNDVQGLQTRQQQDEVTIAAQGAQINGFSQALADLQTKTAPITTTPIYGSGNGASKIPIGYLVTFTQANVQIVNGLGSTETQNGLGNLIVGYNERRGDGTDARTGSHNIVTGVLNNFISSGGILGGYGNSLQDVEEFAVGANNTVSGHQATISAGLGNSVSADYATVSGGENNEAATRGAAVSGGNANHALGQDSSVSGGFHNAADGINATVTGGLFNGAAGDNSSVSGGTGVNAQAGYVPITDGNGNIIGSHYTGAGNGFTWVGAGLASH